MRYIIYHALWGSELRQGSLILLLANFSVIGSISHADTRLTSRTHAFVRTRYKSQYACPDRLPRVGSSAREPFILRNASGIFHLINSCSGSRLVLAGEAGYCMPTEYRVSPYTLHPSRVAGLLHLSIAFSCLAVSQIHHDLDPPED